MTRRRRRRPANRGPALNPNNADMGAKVRVTGGSILQGAHGVIVGNPNTERPIVRFTTGQERALPVNRFQLLLADAGEEALVSPEGHWYFPPIKEATATMECRSCGKIFLDSATCIRESRIHLKNGCGTTTKTKKKSDTTMSRPDADWDF